ncbi:MAG TPA: hypothetical protein VFA39_13215 [Steroidobacteraceae bacterium]|nr:hypothetical protein [Steroidobacteraceae bacterium]
MCQRVVFALILAASACVANFSTASAATTTPSELEAIVGTFNCVTHASGGAIWRFHSVNRAWRGWVRADTTFAPQNGQPADAAFTFVGFDSNTKQWNIVSVDNDGSYYTRSSKSKSFDGSHWVDGYPADGARAVIRLRGKRQYTFDLASPGPKGRAETSNTVCTRE